MDSPRIVSLCPSITETLFAIGAGGSVVGVTRFCTRPARLPAGVARVGGTKTPDLAAIERLRPDIVFMNGEENREADARALAARFEVHVSMPERVRDVPGVVREIGAKAGRPREAGSLAARVERLEEALAAARPSGFSYVYFIWRRPWMAAAEGTYVSDLFSYAGGRNALGRRAARYPEVGAAEVAELRPDVLYFSSEPYPFSEKHLSEIRAAFGASSRIELIDGDDCCWHGARTLEGLARMARIAGRPVTSP